MPLEALLNTCELIGIDPREVINNAYARLLGEMGDAKTMSADEARVEETKRLLRENPMALAAYHDPDKQHYIDGDGIETA